MNPREGFTKRTLPMLPVVPPLTRVPLEITLSFRPRVQATTAPALRSMVEYNQHLGFQEELDGDTRRALAENVRLIIETSTGLASERRKRCRIRSGAWAKRLKTSSVTCNRDS